MRKRTPAAAAARGRTAGRGRQKGLSRHHLQPAQAVVLGFAAAIAVGTALLMLPIARVGPGGASFVEALFTATSAVCVTGLIVVDTPVFWTGFGQVVILVRIQLGGLGIMIFAALIGVVLARKMSVRSRLNTAAEAKTLGSRTYAGSSAASS